jgi:hypothetical protein
MGADERENFKMSDLVEQAQGSRELAHAPESGGLSDDRARFALLREALTNPEVQPEKAVAMAELMFRIEDRQREAAFIAAKVAAISEMPRMGKDGQNTHTQTRYAKWETAQPIITPILARHGLVLNFEISDQNGKVAVTPILSGHGWTERGGAMVLPADVGKGRNDVQAVASAASYAKRHSAFAMLNIVQGGVMSDDDDGSAAGGTPLDAYASLDEHQRSLVDEGRRTALDGVAKYEEWFKALDAQRRGFLAFNTAWPNNVTWHEQNKDAAAKAG